MRSLSRPLAALAVASLALIGPGSPAGGAGPPPPLSVALKTQAVGLPPGAEIEIELRAHYVVAAAGEPVKDASAEGQRTVVERYRREAPEVFRWSFKVPADGRVPEQYFEFVFDGLREPAERGLVRSFVFPLKFKGKFPAGSGHPAWQASRETTVAMSRESGATDAAGYWCFRVQGFPDGYVSYGLTDCRGSLKRAP